MLGVREGLGPYEILGGNTREEWKINSISDLPCPSARRQLVAPTEQVDQEDPLRAS